MFSPKMWPLALFFVLAPCMMALGWWQYRKIKAFAATAARAQGTYVGTRTDTNLVEVTRTGFYRQYRFSTPDGKTYGCSSIVSGLPLRTPKDVVEVLYDPRNPENARINTWLELYGAPAIFMAWGVLVMVIVPVVWAVLSMLWKSSGRA